MTINFYPERKGKTKIRKVMAYMREKGKTFQQTTNIQVDIDKWDSSKQRVKRSHENAMIYNAALDNFSLEIQGVHKEFLIENTFGTLEQFKIYFKEHIKKAKLKDKIEDDNDFTLVSIYDKYLEAKKHQCKPNTITKFEVIKNLLLDYQKYIKSTLKFSSISYRLYDDINAYCVKERKMANNSIAKYFDFLKTFLLWCKASEYYQGEIPKYKVKKNESLSVALTKKELDMLYDYEFDKQVHSQVRDVFCFACYTGARYSDISSIHREELSDTHRNFRSTKTGKLLSVPLQKEARQIISKYKDNIIPLPIISASRTNTYLKQICRIVGIDKATIREKYIGSERTETIVPKYEMITFHTARRTFATLSVKAGKSPFSVMKITGHSDYSTFMKYIKTTSEFIDDDFGGAWF